MKQDASTDRKRSLGVKDPLLNKAHKKVAMNDMQKGTMSTSGKASMVVQLTCKAGAPLFTYTFMLLVTSQGFYFSAGSVWVILFALCAFCYIQYLTVEHCFKKAWPRRLGQLCGFSACCGFVLGVCIHYQYMLFYYKYTNMMYYTNVAASQPVQEFQDAGSLLFTEGTKVDTARAVGYHSIRTAKTLCVAPVIDNQMSSNDPVVFWAVGTGCCSWRSSFNCDDAKTSGNRGGLLILEPTHLVSSSMEWVVEDRFDQEGFDNAVAMAKSVFAISTGKNKRFVRWVADPKDEIDKFRRRGTEYIVVSLVLYFVVAGVWVAKDVYDQQQEEQKRADKITGMSEA